MKVNSLLLPHPVLGKNDDVAGEFKLKESGLSIRQADQKTMLLIDFVLKNETLERLISNKDAGFNVEIECPATFYRKSFRSTEPKFEVEIDKNNLRNKVIVSFYITSNNKIPEYKIFGANSDYADSSFEINEGDVLGYAGTTSFNAEILWEDLRRIFNIMKIERDPEREEGPAIIRLNGDIIYVTLPREDYLRYENYKDENDNFTWIYHASIVFPTLIYVLNEMMSERVGDYQEYKWFIAIDSRRINEDEIRSLWGNPEAIPEIAQILIGKPLSKMFSSIEALSTKQGEE